MTVFDGAETSSRALSTRNLQIKRGLTSVYLASPVHCPPWASQAAYRNLGCIGLQIE